MTNSLNNLMSVRDKSDLGNKFFLLGVFFLPSALPISGIFFLFCLIISFSRTQSYLLKDQWNLPLFISIGLIIFSTLNISLFYRPSILDNYDMSIIWINLINWVPIFFYYWGFQMYLKTNNQRTIFAKYLISGTIPVIISFFLQKMNIFGPFKTFFGLLVWYQKPLIEDTDPLTGLFSNPNYAGIWLTLVLPFVLAFLLEKRTKSLLKKSILTGISFIIVFLIYITDSRNALIGVFISVLLIYGYKKFSYFLISLSFSIIFFKLLENLFITKNSFLEFLSIINNFIQNYLKHLFKFGARIDIWQGALERIQERPFSGWGASTFSFLNSENNNISIPRVITEIQHSHNMPIELAHNFGIPLSLILTTTIFLMLFKAGKYIFFKDYYHDALNLKKAWLSSTIIVFISHLTDLTFYDGKISLLICILFAGLKNILDENKKKAI